MAHLVKHVVPSWSPASRLALRTLATKADPAKATLTPEEEADQKPAYIPGKYGYAPGFVPPPGWSRTLKPKKPPMTVNQLMEHSKRKDKPLPSNASADTAYHWKMHELRYNYQVESLSLEDKRRAEQQQERQRRRQERKVAAQEKAQEQEAFEKHVRQDPFSAENVLNPEGTTVLRNADLANSAVQHFATPEARAQYLEERNQQRKQNKVAVDEARRYELRAKLVELSYNAEKFVTRENIDRYLDRVLMPTGIDATLLADAGIGRDIYVKELNNPATPSYRINELEKLMNGVGDDGQLGVDSFLEHERTADKDTSSTDPPHPAHGPLHKTPDHEDTPPKATQSNPRNVKNTVAGAGAGCMSSMVTCPLDVVKVRLQNQGKGNGIVPLYRGTISTLRRIRAEEGIRGLYRGLGPTMMGYLPTWAIYLSTYEALKQEIAGRAHRTLDHPGVHMLSALGAGATSSILTNPLWVIKTRVMTQNDYTAYRYRNTWHAFHTIVRQESWRGLYKGMGTSLLGLTHVVIHFPLYEKFKLWLRTVPGFSKVEAPPPRRPLTVSASSPTDPPPVLSVQASEISHSMSLSENARPDWENLPRAFPPTLSPNEPDPANRRSINSRGILVASAVSKLIASTMTYPHEVIRTRLQNQVQPPFRYRGILHAIVTIYREEGWRAFYKGLATNLIRTVPASAITLLTYEWLVRIL
ncbi:hypothetical protein IWQ62_003192 [Dispira parvispora]|uniref:Mitochondrial carrier n=1 Tax=Dispira parvispora TaxID=1520584 RepID=A0A9W8AU83_9FUNG|nr:hypothetical protein IWQ62_003192 [Dispira parvispora]